MWVAGRRAFPAEWTAKGWLFKRAEVGMCLVVLGNSKEPSVATVWQGKEKAGDESRGGHNPYHIGFYRPCWGLWLFVWMRWAPGGGFWAEVGRSLISSLTRSLWLLWTRLIEAKEKARSPVRRLGQDTRQEMGGGAGAPWGGHWKGDKW